jgi:hypothetical protein
MLVQLEVNTFLYILIKNFINNLGFNDSRYPRDDIFLRRLLQFIYSPVLLNNLLIINRRTLKFGVFICFVEDFYVSIMKEIRIFGTNIEICM